MTLKIFWRIFSWLKNAIFGQKNSLKDLFTNCDTYAFFQAFKKLVFSTFCQFLTWFSESFVSKFPKILDFSSQFLSSESNVDIFAGHVFVFLAFIFIFFVVFVTVWNFWTKNSKCFCFDFGYFSKYSAFFSKLHQSFSTFQSFVLKTVIQRESFCKWCRFFWFGNLMAPCCKTEFSMLQNMVSEQGFYFYKEVIFRFISSKFFSLLLFHSGSPVSKPWIRLELWVPCNPWNLRCSNSFVKRRRSF